MPTIATREPEQLSLFDLFEPTASPETAKAPIKITIPVDVPAPVQTKPVVINTAKPKPKQLTSKERIAAITAEPAYAAFRRTLNDAIENKDFRSLLECIGVNVFNINREEHVYIHRFGGQTNYAAWSCAAKDRIQFTTHDWESRDEAKTFYSKQDYHRHYDANYSQEIDINFAYVSEQTAELLITPVNIKLSVIKSSNDQAMGIVDEISSGKTFIPAKFIKGLQFIQPDGKLHQIVLSVRPWIKDWLLQYRSFDLKRYLAAPWLETLSKAGFNAVAERFLNPTQFIDEKAIDNFNRLCGPGTKPKDIFKCSKTVYTVLKDEKDLQIWDTIRRLDKKDQITGDSILMVYQMGLRPKDLDTLNSILGQKRNDKPIFTVASLVNYLNRLDMYEAICTTEALQLLNDYLHMCCTLNMPPRVDGDSLKREHDIAARLIRERRNRAAEEEMRKRKEQEQREIEEGNSKLARAEYHENIYFVRPITEYNDLLDEAIQQDNCVASYANRIASGQSRIFTMRETAHPERSLVTIELSPDCKTIRQKYLAHNQVIRNRAMTEFIERWHRQLNAS